MPNTGNINKNFPYPVLGNINDFDGSNLFVLTARYGAKNRQYEFTCNLKYDSFRDDIENFVNLVFDSFENFVCKSSLNFDNFCSNI